MRDSIEVKIVGSNHKARISIGKIVAVVESDDGLCRIVINNPDSPFIVDHLYSEVNNMINHAIKMRVMAESS